MINRKKELLVDTQKVKESKHTAKRITFYVNLKHINGSSYTIVFLFVDLKYFL